MATANDNVLSNSTINENKYADNGLSSSPVTLNRDTSNLTETASEKSSIGTEKLEHRLNEESGLRRRRGKGLDDSFEFVSSNEESNAPTSSTIKESITNSSSVHEQHAMLSSSDSKNVASGESVVKTDDSGGAKPKIREKGANSNSNDSSDVNSNEGRLGSTANESKDKDISTEESNSNAAFECNICLDVARDAVISMCGHLFCWPCLHTWLETRPNRQICPVCKAGIGKDKVVPLYGRDDSNPKDPREKPVPPRPKGQRPEPESTGGPTFGGFGGFGGGGGNGFQMSFGIGAFPFGFFATNFNLGEAGHGHAHGIRGHGHGAPEGSAQFEEEQFLHKVFLWVAFAFIFWLLVA